MLPEGIEYVALDIKEIECEFHQCEKYHLYLDIYTHNSKKTIDYTNYLHTLNYYTGYYNDYTLFYRLPNRRILISTSLSNNKYYTLYIILDLHNLKLVLLYIINDRIEDITADYKCDGQFIIDNKLVSITDDNKISFTNNIYIKSEYNSHLDKTSNKWFNAVYIIDRFVLYLEYSDQNNIRDRKLLLYDKVEDKELYTYTYRDYYIGAIYSTLNKTLFAITGYKYIIINKLADKFTIEEAEVNSNFIHQFDDYGILYSKSDKTVYFYDNKEYILPSGYRNIIISDLKHTIDKLNILNSLNILLPVLNKIICEY